MPVRYFTVFDKHYAARGLVMLESLRRASAGAFSAYYILALDDDAHRVASMDPIPSCVSKISATPNSWRRGATGHMKNFVGLVRRCFQTSS
jgi:hypothetical protein